MANLLQNILNAGSQDISNSYSALANLVEQSKSRDKINGFISKGPIGQQAQDTLNSPLGDLLTGKFSKIPGQIASDVSSLNEKLANGDSTPVMGLAGVDSGGANTGSSSLLNKILGKKSTNIPPSPVRISLPASVYGAGREQAVQATVDNIVPGATATEKYSNLEPTMERLGNKINQVMQQNPQSTSLDQLVNDFDKNLQANGIYRTADNAKSVVQKTAQGYISDLTNAAGGNGQNLNPSQIPDTALQSMKQSVNQDAQSVYKKIAKGTSLSDKDKVILQARQTLDDALTTLHPEIKNLTTMQSHLYDAADSLFKGREGEIKGTQQKNNPNFLQQHWKALTGLGVTLGPILGGVGYSAYLNNSKPQDYHFSSGNVTLPGISDIQDSQGNALSGNEITNYANNIASLNKQEGALQLQAQLNVPSAKAQLQQLELQKQSLTNRYNAVKPIYDQYVETSNQLQGLNQAQQLIKRANPQWFQAIGPIGGQLTGIRAALVPGYAQFQQQLNNLKSQYGIDTSIITQAASPQDADAAINQTVKFYNTKLQNTLKNNGYSTNNQEPTGKDILTKQMQQIANPASIQTAQAPQSNTQSTPDQFQTNLMNALQGK